MRVEIRNRLGLDSSVAAVEDGVTAALAARADERNTPEQILRRGASATPNLRLGIEVTDTEQAAFDGYFAEARSFGDLWATISTHPAAEAIADAFVNNDVTKPQLTVLPITGRESAALDAMRGIAPPRWSIVLGATSSVSLAETRRVMDHVGALTLGTQDKGLPSLQPANDAAVKALADQFATKGLRVQSVLRPPGTERIQVGIYDPAKGAPADATAVQAMARDTRLSSVFELTPQGAKRPMKGRTQSPGVLKGGIRITVPISAGLEGLCTITAIVQNPNTARTTG